MTFTIYDKVALITGGTSGIGFATAKELLRRNVKGVTIVGFNKQNGLKARDDLVRQFKESKVLYFQADVSSKHELEEAYKETIKKFGQLDVVINSAAIINETMWRRLVDINVGGTVNSTLLAFEKYLPKYKSGTEGIIINMSSIAAFIPVTFLPIYTATKLAIMNFTRSLGTMDHYKRSNIRVMTLCPGATMTPMITNYKTMGPFYDHLGTTFVDILPKFQSAEYVANGTVAIIIQGKSGSVWVIEKGEPIIEVNLRHRQFCEKGVTIEV